MFRSWSIDLLRLIILATVVVIATIVSTDTYLVAAIIFPVVLVLLLLEKDPGDIESFRISVPEKAWLGEEMHMDCSVKCSSPGAVLNLEISLPPQFDIVQGSNVHLFFSTKARREFKFSMSVRVLRRGEYTVDLMKYTLHGIGGGLRRKSGKIEIGRKTVVLPRVQVMKKRNVKTFSRKFVPRQSTARIGPPSTEFDSIRNYSHGDPVKSVNWKATARTVSGNTLLVNQYEREGMSTSLLVLDRGGYMRKGTLDTNPFESGIRTAISLSRLLLDRRINTGFWFGQKFGKKAMYVLPSTDIDNFQRIKKLLLYGETTESVKIPMDPGRMFFDSLASTGANVLVMTNITEINAPYISDFIKKASRLASNVLALDILPYGIISKAGDSQITKLYGQVILRKTRNEVYKELPGNARIVSWDPEVERMSTIVSKISGYMR